MRIKDLLSALPEYQSLQLPQEKALLEINNLVSDSRKVQPGSVFVAIRGTKFDSHAVLDQVVAKEALAIVVEDQKSVPSDFKGVVLQVSNSREALDKLAGRFYGDPSFRLLCFGVTGTNGKTSCTYLMEHILNSVGFPTGVIGTINHHLKDQIWPTEMTTPGPIELQSRLKEMKDAGAKAIAMEVSSHALEQHRADGVMFNTVLFTNLSLDHLDYHQTMKEYFKAKQRLFNELLWKSSKVPQFAVINIDDKWGRQLRVAGVSGLWTYGTTKHADFSFKIRRADFERTEFEMWTPFGHYPVILPLCGTHNVYNAVGVIASAASLGIPVPYSVKFLAQFPGIPGRLQSVPNSKGIHVFVDYAHSPDALENVLLSLLRVKKENNLSGRILTLFGCGGDRDKGKRPVMAQIAEKYSDEVIITSDNPRTEDPKAIINEILKGITKTKPLVEPDRKLAIEQALRIARPDDVVLIAGKGHEDYQIIGTEKIHFSDFETAQRSFGSFS